MLILGPFDFVLLVVHILAASIWIGNALFIDLILNRGYRSLPATHIATLSTSVSKRATWLSWGCILTASITGIVLAWIHGQLGLSYLVRYPGLLLLASMGMTVGAMVNGAVITFSVLPATKTSDLKIAARSTKTLNRLIRINTGLAVVTSCVMVVFRGF